MAVLTIQKQVKGLKVRIARVGAAACRRPRGAPARPAAAAPAAGRLSGACCASGAAGPTSAIGSIRQTVSPGRNTISFSGRIAGRRLRPGRYRALLVITDSAGNVSRVERIRFRVLRRRR